LIDHTAETLVSCPRRQALLQWIVSMSQDITTSRDTSEEDSGGNNPNNYAYQGASSH